LKVKPLERSDRARLHRYWRQSPPQICEHCFTNLYVWRRRVPIYLVEKEGGVCILEEWEQTRNVVGPPLGSGGTQFLLDILHAGVARCCVRMPQPTAEALREAGLAVEPDPANADYVYLRQDLVDLAGRAYHRQKNLVNRCLAKYDCQYCLVTPAMTGELLDMQDRWCEERDCRSNEDLCAEYLAIRDALAHFEQFGLRGGAVRINGRIEAYTIGEALNPNTAAVHFEKAMRGFDGLYQVINQWFCKHGLSDFEFVNREQDLGMAGLRRAKRSYHPHHMVEKHVAALDPALLEDVLGPRLREPCGERT
jgi:hypothetical protein